jgi:ATP phosphoribosyltransferase regulatory subunit
MRAEPALPDDQLAAIRAPFLAAGAEQVDTPILQPLNLLLDLAG